MRYPVILTDIEGTTSSISFVKDVLFPFARERLPEFVRAHRDEPAVRDALDATAAEARIDPADTDALIAVLVKWIDQDKKATPLKTLQGMIWRDGYRDAAFRAHMYDDAATALRKWFDDGRKIYVYSSGSIESQKLFFEHSEAGDLTPLFTDYFDTTSGGKREAESYRRIAKAIGVEPRAIVFLSDIEGELDAAAEAGLATRWLRREVREGDPLGMRHEPARSFSELSV